MTCITPQHTNLRFVLLQQVPHTLYTQAHDNAEVAVWGVGADAVHGHNVLVGIH